MKDQEVERLLLSLLDTLTNIPSEQRERIWWKLLERGKGRERTQDEFRLGMFIESIMLIEGDFLLPELPPNIINFPVNKVKKTNTPPLKKKLNIYYEIQLITFHNFELFIKAI